jgi:hypothetical protein
MYVFAFDSVNMVVACLTVNAMHASSQQTSFAAFNGGCGQLVIGCLIAHQSQLLIIHAAAPTKLSPLLPPSVG